MSKQRITPTLWFDGNAEEAVSFYTSIFKHSKVHNTTPHTGAEPGPQRGPLVIHFQLDGQDFLALDGGPQFKFTEAISLTVYCDGQKEVDEYWNKLIAGGGEGGQKYNVTEAISPPVYCGGKKEVEEYGNKLTAGGGGEAPCGWLKDRFG